jgi:O-antigen ligase
VPVDPAFEFGHAHNALAHIAATTGLVGAGLALLAAAAALAGAFAALPPGGIATYAAGPALALVALLLVSPIDPVNINQQTGALFMLLIGLCAPAGPHTSRSRDRL